MLLFKISDNNNDLVSDFGVETLFWWSHVALIRPIMVITYGHKLYPYLTIPGQKGCLKFLWRKKLLLMGH